KLLLIDLGNGRARLGGSCLAQVYGQLGREAPDCDDPHLLKSFFAALIELKRQRLALAYHDRSDGGVFVTLVEMCFAGHCGIDVNFSSGSPTPSLPRSTGERVATLFNEELGAVLQVRSGDLDSVLAIFNRHGLAKKISVIGDVLQNNRVRIAVNGKTALD